MRISAAEETATQAFEEVGNMRDEIADLRERLQKVQLLINQSLYIGCTYRISCWCWSTQNDGGSGILIRIPLGIRGMAA